MIGSRNQVVIAGNLTRDPEMKYTTTGKAVAQFSLAVEDSYEKDGKTQESVVYVDCKSWQAMAEKVATMKKGGAVVVIGKLKVDSWEDKQTHQKRSKMYVLAEVVTSPFGGAKKKEATAATSPKAAEPEEDQDEIPF